MRVAIISDLHLESVDDPKFALFEQCLSTIEKRAGRLLILGDLFDAWIGDDDNGPLAGRVATGLRRLADAGIEIGFQHGNRDFLLGADYARRSGMRLLPEEAIIRVGDANVLIMHGDSLCTDDAAYLAARRQFRDRDWQREFLERPLAERRAYAALARAASRTHASAQSASIGDVVPAAALEALERHGAALLVHGHTHRPALHHARLGDRVVRRVVTADWLDERGELLWLSAGPHATPAVRRETVTLR